MKRTIISTMSKPLNSRKTALRHGLVVVPTRLGLQQTRRYSDARGHQVVFDAVVVGSGPAGVAVVGNILHLNPSARIRWVDPSFTGGRLQKYVDVSSNTKVQLFLDFANALEPFRKVIHSTASPNAITDLEGLDADAGCRLRYAHGLVMMLTEGLQRLPGVDAQTGTIVDASLNSHSSLWSIATQNQDATPSPTVYSPKLILCTGSSPTTRTFEPHVPKPIDLDLDTALDRDRLREQLSTQPGTTIGVIGASHSAIVVLMNLYELATTSHPGLRIKWFTRRPLSYAQYMDGWILRDNTGLKGASGDFARAHLEDETLPQSPVGRYLEKIDCSVDEPGAFRTHLPLCTHLVQAIGYKPDPIPRLQVDNQPLGQVTNDGRTGQFQDKQGRYIPGLYGAGIAFPEEVTDPTGTKEHAVGMWKFMKYLQRVVPEHWDVK